MPQHGHTRRTFTQRHKLGQETRHERTWTRRPVVLNQTAEGGCWGQEGGSRFPSNETGKLQKPAVHVSYGCTRVLATKMCVK